MVTAFKNLEQRVVNSYMDTFPNFVPAQCSAVTEPEQKQFYDFLKKLYRILFDNPLLLYTKLSDDGFFTYRFNRAIDNKPKLHIQMKSNADKIEKLLEVLFDIGISGQVTDNQLVVDNAIKINTKYLTILQQCGLTYAKERHQTVLFYDNGQALFRAWKWMATRPNASKLSFSRCLFNSEYSYASDIFSRLLGNEKAFASLEQYLIENGYTRMDNRDNHIALDYVKNYAKKDMPVKDAWAERSHAGISLEYHVDVAKPACISLRVPRLKELLNGFDLMEDALKEFVVKTNKKCDHCRYCVQTDKTEKRNLIYIPVSLGQEYNLCPLFPGFSYCWDFIDEPLGSSMRSLLSFIDVTIKE